MNTPQNKITNPMTIIAIFAALTEASATVSLPFLDDGDRDVYVWFLISFPFCLILLFFVTLNFNYKSLYAPSDFEKGEDFIKVIDGATRSRKTKAPPSNAPLPKQHNNTTDSAENFHPPERLVKCPPQSFIFRQHKCRYSYRNAQDPPTPVNLLTHHAMQYTFHLPHTLHGLHIIDTRRINTKKDVDTLITEIGQKIRSTPDARDLIIFLVNQKSAQLINQNAFKILNQDKTKHSFYLVYNLSARTLTQTCQAND
ncbi:hypothetical protein ACN1C3_32320 [Pseudomonas sp. H11T01]|uniref:hypothetical protein n=1 Tax=Pseudomonas sp. H11T01 TaxID=3402749 RepID=UPI003AC16C4B